MRILHWAIGFLPWQRHSEEQNSRARNPHGRNAHDSRPTLTLEGFEAWRHEHELYRATDANAVPQEYADYFILRVDAADANLDTELRCDTLLECWCGTNIATQGLSCVTCPDCGRMLVHGGTLEARPALARS